ncbi:unnamed protein product [Closterium sp. Yama58-4]|nr:unnamed protein product [Closterium sp. Yama58-4]
MGCFPSRSSVDCCFIAGADTVKTSANADLPRVAAVCLRWRPLALDPSLCCAAHPEFPTHPVVPDRLTSPADLPRVAAVCLRWRPLALDPSLCCAAHPVFPTHPVVPDRLTSPADLPRVAAVCLRWRPLALDPSLCCAAHPVFPTHPVVPDRLTSPVWRLCAVAGARSPSTPRCATLPCLLPFPLPALPAPPPSTVPFAALKPSLSPSRSPPTRPLPSLRQADLPRVAAVCRRWRPLALDPSLCCAAFCRSHHLLSLRLSPSAAPAPPTPASASASASASATPVPEAKGDKLSSPLLHSASTPASRSHAHLHSPHPPRPLLLSSPAAPPRHSSRSSHRPSSLSRTPLAEPTPLPAWQCASTYR